MPRGMDFGKAENSHPVPQFSFLTYRASMGMGTRARHCLRPGSAIGKEVGHSL